MKAVRRDEVLPLGAYEEIRDRFRARMIEEKKRRRVAVGKNLTALFENHDTALLQIQEMLRTERITAEAAVQHEIDTFNALVPGEHELSATFFVEYPEAAERDRMLVELAGIEDRFYLKVDEERVFGKCEMRGDRTDRTTAVHYVKFALGKALADQVRRGCPLAVGVSHPKYEAEAAIVGDTLASVRGDLSA